MKISKFRILIAASQKDERLKYPVMPHANFHPGPGLKNISARENNSWTNDIFMLDFNATIIGGFGKIHV